jgi:cellulose synthase operon protein C
MIFRPDPAVLSLSKHGSRAKPPFDRLRATVAFVALTMVCVGAIAASPPPTPTAQARALLAKGDVEGALKVDPKNPDVLIFAGNIVRDRYGLLPALPWYDRALEIKPDHLDVLFEKAATLGDAGRSDEMLDVTRKLLTLSKNNAQACYLQAVLLARAGKWDMARVILYRAGDRMDRIAGMNLMRAIVMMQAGSNDGAIAQLRPILNDRPDNAKARRLLGLALMRAGSRDEAIEALRPLAERGDGYALMLTGRAFEAMGNRAAAAEALDRASRAAAGVLSADHLAGLDKFLATNPGNAAAQRAAADRALSRGEWAGAAAIYDSLSTRLGNRDPVRLVNAGWAQVGLGQPDAAVDLGKRAYALAPMSPLATASFGSFLARAGKAAEAVPLLEKAVAMVPEEARFAQELAAARKSL